MIQLYRDALRVIREEKSQDNKKQLKDWIRYEFDSKKEIMDPVRSLFDFQKYISNYFQLLYKNFTTWEIFASVVHHHKIMAKMRLSNFYSDADQIM